MTDHGARADPARSLARRLRELREAEWPEVTITQRQLAHALSGQKPVSVPLVSAWENVNRPTVPPEDRLIAYATFFASRRSIEQVPFRMLRSDEFTIPERNRRDRLMRELLAARTACVRSANGVRRSTPAVRLVGGPWQFGDTASVTIVCPALPEAQRRLLPEPDDPDRAYAELYGVADLDALFELHGHIRAANPISQVTVRTPTHLDPDDYTTHLVVLGGVDWNGATRQLLRLLEVPVRQQPGGAGARFETNGDSGQVRHHAELTPDGTLLADVGHFFRAPNPFNHERTATICNGLTSRGVLGSVRALTDGRFRDRNAAWVSERFSEVESFSVLMRVQVVDRAVLTPDWTVPDTHLHDWP